MRCGPVLRIRIRLPFLREGATHMKIGLQIPNFTWPGGPKQIPGKIAEIARAADDAGFYSLWVMDHFFQISVIGPPEHDMLEGYTTLGYLSALTRRVKLGTLV